MVHLLPSCVPTVTHVLEPLIITITKDGSDEAACLSGKVPCKTFRYAVGEDSSGVDGNGGDVIMIITYTQTLNILTNNYFTIGSNISSLTIVGQAGDDYTLTCEVSYWDRHIAIHSDENGSPKHLYLEKIHCGCSLSVAGITKVEVMHGIHWSRFEL